MCGITPAVRPFCYVETVPIFSNNIKPSQFLNTWHTCPYIRTCFLYVIIWNGYIMFKMIGTVRTKWMYRWGDATICTQILWTHLGRVTNICVSKWTTIGSDNGLSPGRHRAIIWANAGVLLIGPSGTDFTDILIDLIHFHSRISSGKWRPFCLGLNVLISLQSSFHIVSPLKNHTLT